MARAADRRAARRRHAPTADRVREALFSMLASRIGSFEGLAVVDVFAGTGALGLEALSRGAAHASFIENDRGAVANLKANITKLGADFEAEVLAVAAESVGKARQPCNLVFLDPPYASGLGAGALDRLRAQGWIAPQALVSVESARGTMIDATGFTVEAMRDYGKSRLHLLRAA